MFSSQVTLAYQANYNFYSNIWVGRVFTKTYMVSNTLGRLRCLRLLLLDIKRPRFESGYIVIRVRDLQTHMFFKVN
jgi:hypothetical protein